MFRLLENTLFNRRSFSSLEELAFFVESNLDHPQKLRAIQKRSQKRLLRRYADAEPLQKRLIAVFEFLNFPLASKAKILPTETKEVALKILKGEENLFETSVPAETLGKGSYGCVVKMVHKDLSCACKEFYELDKAAVLKEYKALTLFQDPHIIKPLYSDGMRIFLPLASKGVLLLLALQKNPQRQSFRFLDKSLLD